METMTEFDRRVVHGRTTSESVPSPGVSKALCRIASLVYYSYHVHTMTLQNCYGMDNRTDIAMLDICN
jgi:hypothetical protein